MYAPDEIERFLSKQVFTDIDSCWGWAGSLCPGTGYSQGFHPRSSGRKCRKYFAHQMAFELAYGPVPDGMHVLHSCGRKTCSNPRHVYAGTRVQNMADMRAHGGSNRAILKPADVAAIVAEKRAGSTYAKLAARFGVSNQSVANVLAGRTYSHLTGISPRSRA